MCSLLLRWMILGGLSIMMNKGLKYCNVQKSQHLFYDARDGVMCWQCFSLALLLLFVVVGCTT